MRHAKIFINLPVKDLDRSKDFFAKIGFSFDPHFTDKNAACLVLGRDTYAMLVVTGYFSRFTKKKIADAKASTELITALSVESREDVDMMLAKALAAGASESRKPEDHGFMYGRSFEDLDGHQWEFFWMEPRG